MYNDKHLFHPNELKRYSLGTKNKNLMRNADARARSPPAQNRLAPTIFTPDFEMFPASRNARPVPSGVKPFQFGYDLMSVAE